MNMITNAAHAHRSSAKARCIAHSRLRQVFMIVEQLQAALEQPYAAVAHSPADRSERGEQAEPDLRHAEALGRVEDEHRPRARLR